MTLHFHNAMKWGNISCFVGLASLVGVCLFGWRPQESEIRNVSLSTAASREQNPSVPSDVAELLSTARQAVESVTDAGEKAAVLNELAGVQIRAGDFDGARQTTESMADAARRTSLLRDLAAAQAEIGNRTDARQTCLLVRQAAEGMMDAREKATLLNAIAAIQARVGDKTEAGQTCLLAREAAESIAEHYYQVEALSSIAATQVLAGFPEEARQTTQRLTDAYSRAKALLEGVVLAQREAGDADGRFYPGKADHGTDGRYAQ